MKRIKYQISIKASSKVVFEKMLGLNEKSDYEFWTSIFNPTSTFEGSWNSGERIHFIGTGEDGKKGGMVSEILENKPNLFISIRHKGILNDGIEILEGPDVEDWKGALENYFFEDTLEGMRLTIETDVNDEYKDYFDTTWPKALKKLKELVEK